MKKKLLPIVLLIVLIISLIGGIALVLRKEVANEFFINEVAPPLIMSTIKVFISLVDLQEILTNFKGQLKNIDDDHFARELSKVLTDIDKLGVTKQAENFGIKKDLARGDAILLVESWNKEKLVALVDSIPYSAASELMRNNFFQKKEINAHDEKSLVDQLEEAKTKLLEKLKE